MRAQCSRKYLNAKKKKKKKKRNTSIDLIARIFAISRVGPNGSDLRVMEFLPSGNYNN
jgi:hypothetical protein